MVSVKTLSTSAWSRKSSLRIRAKPVRRGHIRCPPPHCLGGEEKEAFSTGGGGVIHSFCSQLFSGTWARLLLSLHHHLWGLSVTFPIAPRWWKAGPHRVVSVFTRVAFGHGVKIHLFQVTFKMLLIYLYNLFAFLFKCYSRTPVPSGSESAISRIRDLKIVKILNWGGQTRNTVHIFTMYLPEWATRGRQRPSYAFLFMKNT